MSYEKTAKDLLEPLFALYSQRPEHSMRMLASTCAREKTLTKPEGSLGRLEALSEHLAYWQGVIARPTADSRILPTMAVTQEPSIPNLDDVRVIIFAARHGICDEGVSAYPSVVTQQMVANFRNGGAAINQLCKVASARLAVESLWLDEQTESFLHSPAMSYERCARAFMRGASSISSASDANLIALGEMGIGNSCSASAMLYALYGGSAEEWTGSGTGLDSAAYEHKIAVVENSVRRFADKYASKDLSKSERAWEILRELGGFELAAIVGALLKARALRIPIVLDGFPCCAAAAIAKGLDGRSLENCLLAHEPAQRGARELNSRLCLGEPLLRLGMRLGEGSAAALALLIVRAALACHQGMASFEQAAVETKL